MAGDGKLGCVTTGAERCSASAGAKRQPNMGIKANQVSSSTAAAGITQRQLAHINQRKANRRRATQRSRFQLACSADRRKASPFGTDGAREEVGVRAGRRHSMENRQAPGFFMATRSSVALRSAPFTWIRP